MMKRLAAALLVVLVAASCGGGPVDPSQNQAQTFAGTVQPANVDIQLFTVSNLGEISVTVNSFTPGNVVLGVAYGQPSGINCLPIQQNAVSNTNVGRTALTGQIFIKGEYCLAVFDPSGILLNIAPWSVAQNYNVTVSHP